MSDKELLRCLILDAGAFINGVAQQLPGALVTSPLVFLELKSPTAREGAARLEAAGRLNIVAPRDDAVHEIRETLKQTKDSFVASEADIELLALARTYAKQGAAIHLITNDYALQNIAAILKIPFNSYGQRGIKEVWQWEIYCPACFRVFNDAKRGDNCPDCNVKLKRRPKRYTRSKIR